MRFFRRSVRESVRKSMSGGRTSGGSAVILGKSFTTETQRTQRTHRDSLCFSLCSLCLCGEKYRSSKRKRGHELACRRAKLIGPLVLAVVHARRHVRPPFEKAQVFVELCFAIPVLELSATEKGRRQLR